MDSQSSLNSQNPHLASILQDLAQFTQGAAAQQTRWNAQAAALRSGGRVAGDDDDGVPARPNDSSVSAIAQDPRLTATRKSSTTTGNTMKPASSSKDIIEWSPAVKFVMSTLSRNAETGLKVKSLIKNQNDNEQRWWNSREALVKKHRGREDGRRKLADLDLLRPAGENTAAVTAEADRTTSSRHSNRLSPAQQQQEEDTELKGFDRKVYAALQQMAVAMDRELTALGVPFFAIRHDLIATQTSTKSEAGGGGGDGMITKVELRELQKRMLLFLQDLFGD
jgi:hypothetical protein